MCLFLARVPKSNLGVKTCLQYGERCDFVSLFVCASQQRWSQRTVAVAARLAALCATCAATRRRAARGGWLDGRILAGDDVASAQVLGHIDAQSLLPPLLVVQMLAQNGAATLGPIKPCVCCPVVRCQPASQRSHRSYIIRRVAKAEQRRRDDERRATQLRFVACGSVVATSRVAAHSEEIAAMNGELAALRGGAVLFQANKCATCSSAIELPAVHFLCMVSAMCWFVLVRLRRLASHSTRIINDVWTTSIRRCVIVFDTHACALSHHHRR